MKEDDAWLGRVPLRFSVDRCSIAGLEILGGYGRHTGTLRSNALAIAFIRRLSLINMIIIIDARRFLENLIVDQLLTVDAVSWSGYGPQCVFGND